jgi:hypothetical protein
MTFFAKYTQPIHHHTMRQNGVNSFPLLSAFNDNINQSEVQHFDRYKTASGDIALLRIRLGSNFKMRAYILKGSGNREQYDTHERPEVCQTMGRKRYTIRVILNTTEHNFVQEFRICT